MGKRRWKAMVEIVRLDQSGVEFETDLRKSGNSLTITVPANVQRTLQLEHGARVHVTLTKAEEE